MPTSIPASIARSLPLRPVPGPLDDCNRASVKKLAALLGWNPTDALVARVTSPTAAVRPGRPTRAEPRLRPVQLDAGGRLTVPPAVKAALQLGTGDQVVACAVAETGVLHLAGAADVLQQLSGELSHSPSDVLSERDLAAAVKG
ncbi:MAG: hypothetical protein JWQ15_2408 [Marmoricola sp.]|nr:hypothetical protein [Marmoricola sp.]